MWESQYKPSDGTLNENYAPDEIERDKGRQEVEGRERGRDEEGMRVEGCKKGGIKGCKEEGMEGCL